MFGTPEDPVEDDVVPEESDIARLKAQRAAKRQRLESGTNAMATSWASGMNVRSQPSSLNIVSHFNRTMRSFPCHYPIIS